VQTKKYKYLLPNDCPKVNSSRAAALYWKFAIKCIIKEIKQKKEKLN